MVESKFANLVLWAFICFVLGTVAGPVGFLLGLLGLFIAVRDAPNP